MGRLLTGGTFVVLLVVLAGCSGSDPKEDPSVSSAPPSDSASGSSSSSGSSEPSATPAAGDREDVSVASFVLPSAARWTKTVLDGDADLEEVQWVSFDPDSGAQSCVVSLGVQNPYAGGLDAYRTYLQATGGDALTSVEEDPQAPTKTTGVLALYAGGTGGTAAFTSVVRTWVTEGRTKITLSATSTDERKDDCDPAGVAASLEWTGEERPAPGAGQE